MGKCLSLHWCKVAFHGGFHPEMAFIVSVNFYLKKIGELAPEVFFSFLTRWGVQSIISYLPKIKTPTLIMGGDKGYNRPISSQLIFNNLIPDSDFYLVKDGSHVSLKLIFLIPVNQKSI